MQSQKCIYIYKVYKKQLKKMQYRVKINLSRGERKWEEKPHMVRVWQTARREISTGAFIREILMAEAASVSIFPQSPYGFKSSKWVVLMPGHRHIRSALTRLLSWLRRTCGAKQTEGIHLTDISAPGCVTLSGVRGLADSNSIPSISHQNTSQWRVPGTLLSIAHHQNTARLTARVLLVLENKRK